MREPDKSRTSPWRRLRAACTALGRDRDGSALFYTTLSLPVLIGFAVLAIDGARFMNLNSTLQHAADGLALAAAGELDRNPDACERAERALENLVENDQMFGDLGAATITADDVTWRFLETLPANDSDPIVEANEGDCDTAEDAALVRYIEVWVKPQNFSTLFPASFIGGSNAARTNAVAVAGFDAVVCDFTPMFICNPWDKPITEVIADGDNIGKQIKFHSVPADCDEDCPISPGNFGILETPISGKNKDIKEMLATTNPGACFVQNSVTTKPGISGIGPWLNVRFDLYDAETNKVSKVDGYGPARNVRKGYTGETCAKLKKQDPYDPEVPGSAPNTGLGRDASFTGNLGNGQWSVEDYWSGNFGTAPPKGWNDTTNLPTRYEVYQYEQESVANYNNFVIGGTESGAPMCATPEPDVDRRILYAAVLDCEPEGVVKGKHTGQAEGFIEMFLTEPADHEPGMGPSTIFVEITDIIDPGDDKVARDRVQLYR